LTRVEACSFEQSSTITFAEIEEAKTKNKHSELLSPIAAVLNHFDCMQVNETLKLKVMNGQKLPIPNPRLKTDPFLVMHYDQLLAIYQIHPENNEEIKPVRVFSR